MKSKLITLIAKKVRVRKTLAPGVTFRGLETEIYTEGGRLKCVFPVDTKQPRRGQKTIIINCFRFNLKWE